MRTRKSIGLMVVSLLLLVAAACNDEETSLGVALTDPSTLYDGQQVTLTAYRAMSYREDSLITSSASPVVIGNYSDATYGKVSSEWLTQIALPSSSTSINFESVDIDSVVLTLVNGGLFPDSTASYNLHFEVRQLAEPLSSDSTYYAFSNLPVESLVLCDTTVRVAPTDTLINLKLSSAANAILAQVGTAAEFAEAARGLRIKLKDDADAAMLLVNVNATKTALKVHP